eukprot:scaffold34039_cov18-Tisochrysis_lutea.AAC.4
MRSERVERCLGKEGRVKVLYAWEGKTQKRRHLRLGKERKGREGKIAVLETLDDAAKVIYPKECISLHNLGKASLPAAEILLLLWQYCSKQSTFPIGPDAFHVPAIDRFASLLGIAWYKKFTLEPQPHLSSAELLQQAAKLLLALCSCL